MNKTWVSLGIAIVSLLVGVSASHAENPDHVRQLLQTNICKGCDLSGSMLSGLDLREANLSGANLSRADLSGSHFARANLQKANLTHAKITNAVFAGANIKGATLAGAENLGLCEENIFTQFSSGSNPTSTCLILSLLGTFEPEELCKPEYDLKALKIGDSFCFMMSEGTFAASSLFKTSFKSFLQVTSFYGADLTNANFQSVNLTGADFRYASLNNTNLEDANLDHANLLNATIQNVSGQSFENALVKISDLKTLIQNAIALEKEATRKSIGLSTMGTLLRAQQAYRLENDRFANDIAQLDAFVESQDDYDLTIQSQPNPAERVVITVISRAPDLKSYVGFAAQTDGEFSQMICETVEPSSAVPDFDLNLMECPTDMQRVE